MNLPPPPSPTLINEAATAMAIRDGFVEKDWYVTQAIKIISSIEYKDFKIIFSGGTALSKAYGLLQRFSEDIDFRLVAPAELETRKELSAYKATVVSTLRRSGFTILDEDIKARDENRYISLKATYPSIYPPNTELRPHILIEIAARPTQLVPLMKPIASFVATLSKSQVEIPEIECIDPTESAADKLSALAWRIPDRVRGDANDDPAIVRHIHDLALLKDCALSNPHFKEMVTASMLSDNLRARNDMSLSTLTASEKFKVMFDILERDQEYQKEYNKFVLGVSYAPTGTAPNYSEALNDIKLMITLLGFT